MTITDNVGCTGTFTEFVDTQLDALDITGDIVSPVCTTATGSITIVVNGGTTPYSYSWSTGATTADLSSLFAGNYDLTVFDANGCVATDTLTLITDAGDLSGSLSEVSATCTAADGLATVTAIDGTQPYSYLWSNGSTTAENTGLTAGNYTVTVSDANGCIYSGNIAVTATTGSVSVSGTATNATAAGSQDGAVDVTASNGTAPYTYAWSNGATTEDINGVNPGSFSVTVTDANGCSATAQFTVGQATSIAADMNLLSLQLFPNPATAQTRLTARLGAVQDVRITLHTAIGQEVQSVQYNGVTEINHVFDLRTLPAAVYFTELTVNDKVYTLRLVVQ